VNQQEYPLKIFVSHIHEEAALGAVVKDGLEDAFPGRIATFVSSDKRDNPGGDRWLDKIEQELKDSRTCMLVSLVSLQSVREPWISIELGAAWIQGHAVFPLCHSGQLLGALPRPMQDFGGADLAVDDAAERLIKTVEKTTGLKTPTRWPTARFLEDMREAVHRLAAQRSPIAEAVTRSEPGLPSEQVQILRRFAQIQNSSGKGTPASDAARVCHLSSVEFTYHAHELEERGFVQLIPPGYGGGDAYYRLLPDGIGWLIHNSQMPK
jgi:hypothetical protein